MTLNDALKGMELILAWFVLDVAWNVSLNFIADLIPDEWYRDIHSNR